jgi:hypothetical protein
VEGDIAHSTAVVFRLKYPRHGDAWLTADGTGRGTGHKMRLYCGCGCDFDCSCAELLD